MPALAPALLTRGTGRSGGSIFAWASLILLRAHWAAFARYRTRNSKKSAKRFDSVTSLARTTTTRYIATTTRWYVGRTRPTGGSTRTRQSHGTASTAGAYQTTTSCRAAFVAATVDLLASSSRRTT